jgi:hypothetical protein
VTHSVVLPSGNTTPLRVLGLRDFVEAGGDSESIVRASWAHEGIDLMDDESVETYLDPGDIAFVVDWVVENLDAEAIDGLALVSHAYHIAPSRYLRVADLLAGFRLDASVAARIAELENEADSETEVSSETRVVGRMDDTD